MNMYTLHYHRISKSIIFHEVKKFLTNFLFFNVLRFVQLSADRFSLLSRFIIARNIRFSVFNQ